MQPLLRLSYFAILYALLNLFHPLTRPTPAGAEILCLNFAANSLELFDKSGDFLKDALFHRKILGIQWAHFIHACLPSCGWPFSPFFQ